MLVHIFVVIQGKPGDGVVYLIFIVHQGQPGVGLVLVPPPIYSKLGTQRRCGRIFYLKKTRDKTLSYHVVHQGPVILLHIPVFKTKQKCLIYMILKNKNVLLRKKIGCKPHNTTQVLGRFFFFFKEYIFSLLRTGLNDNNFILI